MATNFVRWGILGVADINQRVLPSWAKARNAKLVGIASRSLEKAQAAAKAAGIPKAFGSYEALLDDPDIDAVYNPLPNTLHDEWTRRAAERGKHVLCEKPLTPTAASAKDLVAFCQARKICLMDGFMWPHHPRTDKLRQYLESGNLGEIRRVSGSFTFKMEPLDPANIRLQHDLGGGSLMDVGCYPVYAIRWVFGVEPVRVWATARYEHGVDVEMSGVLWLGDDRLATFDCGFTQPMRQGLEIVGTEGVLTVPEMWLPPRRALFYVRRGKSLEEHLVEDRDQIQCMVENFSRCVLEGKSVMPSPEEAVKTLRVLDALAQAAQKQQVTSVG